MSSGYIYLLKPLRSIIDNEEIYKIGKTKRNNFKRFNEYPIGSILMLQSSCKNCDLMERILLKIFNEQFIKETDYGREYFRGDLFEMKRIINSEIMKEYVIINDSNNDISSSNNLIELSINNENEVVEMYEKIEIEPCGMIENNEAKITQYACEICHYKTLRKNDFNNHLLTAKHKQITNINTAPKYNCKCGKSYKNRQGLYKHHKCCSFKLSKQLDIDNTKLIIDVSQVIDLIKQNKEEQKLLVQQVKEYNEQSKEIFESMNKVFNLYYGII